MTLIFINQNVKSHISNFKLGWVTKPIEDSTRRNRNIIKDTACDKNFTYGEAMKTLKWLFKLTLTFSANQI